MPSAGVLHRTTPIAASSSPPIIFAQGVVVVGIRSSISVGKGALIQIAAKSGPTAFSGVKQPSHYPAKPQDKNENYLILL
jgi:hypothetical protein